MRRRLLRQGESGIDRHFLDALQRKTLSHITNGAWGPRHKSHCNFLLRDRQRRGSISVKDGVHPKPPEKRVGFIQVCLQKALVNRTPAEGNWNDFLRLVPIAFLTQENRLELQARKLMCRDIGVGNYHDRVPRGSGGARVV